MCGRNALLIVACALLAIGLPTVTTGQTQYTPMRPPQAPQSQPQPQPQYTQPQPVRPQLQSPAPQQQYGPSQQPQYGGPQYAPQQPTGQPPLEYAFRPDLTNPQYGECLRMEKNWRALWERYYQLYSQALAMRNHPGYAQMTWRLQTLRRQLDAAWQTFSSQCVYYPQYQQAPER